MPTRREGHGGLPIALDGTTERDPEFLYAHANGFCKELWRPVAHHVGGSRSWWSMDLRGHGDTGGGSFPYGWHVLALDILAVLGDTRDVVGVGHSMGAASLARAEILEPGTFRHLVLIEPILFPPPHGRTNIPLADLAQHRRSVFPDRDATHRRFSRGGPYAAWDPFVLDLYVDHAWGPGPEGWEIKCGPAVEADYYREGNNVDTWDRLPEIQAPVTLVAGSESDTHTGEYLHALERRFAAVDLVVVEDHGHLVPMESPRSIAEIIDRVA
ncbi:MAG: alpha/beta hydrolase [Acidimicrobiia bacterium]|nr:alpha/beta hydrolase [Acidimicrobiia bacterium]